MGVDGDPAGRVPSPTFTPHPGGLEGEARARDLISGCWTADVLPLGQIDIPIWIQFSSEPLLSSSPCLTLGWGLGSLQPLAGSELEYLGPWAAFAG